MILVNIKSFFSPHARCLSLGKLRLPAPRRRESALNGQRTGWGRVGWVTTILVS
jgi:hypothetical protein